MYIADITEKEVSLPMQVLLSYNLFFRISTIWNNMCLYLATQTLIRTEKKDPEFFSDWVLPAFIQTYLVELLGDGYEYPQSTFPKS